MSLMPFHQMLFAVSFIRSVTFTLKDRKLDVRIALGLLGLKISRNSTMTGPSRLSISKMSSTCPISRLRKSVNCLNSTPKRWGKPSLLRLLPLFINRLLVSRFSSIECAQILTEEMNIPKNETITLVHFSKAHRQLLRERNTNIDHLIVNIRKKPRFERILMRITAYDDGLDFNLRDESIDELATYGVISEGTDGMCEIANPIYLYSILQAFKPAVNGLEQEYFPEDTADGFHDYLTSTEEIEMGALLDNFRDFIARAGFKILQVPDTPQESVGRHLLLAYIEQFVKLVGGLMYIEVQTGRGRIDLLITHNQRKYIVETKVWRGEVSYQTGKKQLAAYLKLEGAQEGYYVVFDHRNNPTPRVETEMIDGLTIRSYVIPVVQEQPSSV